MHGYGFDQMQQLQGLLFLQGQERIAQRKESPSTPGGRHQKVTNIMTWLRSAGTGGQTGVKTQLRELTAANQALEARVAKLEHQLATVTAAQL